VFAGCVAQQVEQKGKRVEFLEHAAVAVRLFAA
jgi:hypothetical protein